MALAFEAEERVPQSPEAVWARLTDWNRGTDWMTGVDSMSADGPTAVGTQIVFQARGQERASEITEVEPGRCVTLRSTQGPVTAHYTYRVEPDGSGSRLKLRADCEISGPLKLLAPVIRRAIRRTDGGQLRALKDVIARA